MVSRISSGEDWVEITHRDAYQRLTEGQITSYCRRIYGMPEEKKPQPIDHEKLKSFIQRTYGSPQDPQPVTVRIPSKDTIRRFFKEPQKEERKLSNERQLELLTSAINPENPTVEATMEQAKQILAMDQTSSPTALRMLWASMNG